MNNTTIKSFYALVASLAGLGIISWIYTTFRKKNETKKIISEEDGTKSVSDNKETNSKGKPLTNNIIKITETTSNNHVESDASESINEVATNDDINDNIFTDSNQIPHEIHEKAVGKTNGYRNGLAVSNEGNNITDRALDESSTKESDQDPPHSEENNYPYNKMETSSGIDGNKNGNVIAMNSSKYVTTEPCEGKVADDASSQNYSPQKSGLECPDQNQLISRDVLPISSQIEKISAVLAPAELDEEDSLEEMDEVRTSLEESRSNSEVGKVESKDGGKGYFEENSDCGLGESLMEEGIDVQDSHLDINKNQDQRYILHEHEKNNDISTNPQREKETVIFDKSHKKKERNDRIAAIFQRHPTNDFENKKTNLNKFKSKIPHFNQTPTMTQIAKTKPHNNGDFVKETDSKYVKGSKIKSFETSGLRKPTNLRKPTLKSKEQFSTNRKIGGSSTKHLNAKFKSTFDQNKHFQTEEKVFNSLRREKQENNKLPNQKGLKLPANYNEIPNKKRSKIVEIDNERDDIQARMKSPASNLSCNNLDDSLEDVTSAVSELADSLEDLSGILEEGPCFDALNNNDDVDSIEEFISDEELKEFPKDIKEKINLQFLDEELFLLDGEREEKEMFEEGLDRMPYVEEDENDFDSSEEKVLFDQSFFLEESENELLLNLAFQNNDIDAFFSLLSRTSISKQQRDQCWAFLEQLSTHPSYAPSFHPHIFLLLSFIDKSSLHYSNTLSPLKIVFNLSKQKESIIFILASKACKGIFRLFQFETEEEVLLNWLPLATNLLRHVRLHHVTPHVIWKFCCQQQLYGQQLNLEMLDEKMSSTHYNSSPFPSSSSSHHDSMEDKLICETLFQILFGQQSRQILMDRVHDLTNHPNTHLTHLARCLYTSLVHS